MFSPPRDYKKEPLTKWEIFELKLLGVIVFFTLIFLAWLSYKIFTV